MIQISKINLYGQEAAIRGMRNSWNSWSKSDSNDLTIGDTDLQLMRTLAEMGTSHRKYMRMMHVSMDILAPLYWWKQFDTYKIGTTTNSTSTMHTIAEKEFDLDDFSHDHLYISTLPVLKNTIDALNNYRTEYLASGNENDWYQMIQLLPSSFNQLRTVDINFETLWKIVNERAGHKLQEWQDFCSAISCEVPYAKELIFATQRG